MDMVRAIRAPNAVINKSTNKSPGVASQSLPGNVAHHFSWNKLNTKTTTLITGIITRNITIGWCMPCDFRNRLLLVGW